MSSAFPARPKKPLPSRFWLIRPGIGDPRISPPPLGRKRQQYWEKFPMRNSFHREGEETRRLLSCAFFLLLLCLSCISCSQHPDPDTIVVIIESSPTNLDPRIGTDIQSELIDEL